MGPFYSAIIIMALVTPESMAAFNPHLFVTLLETESPTARVTWAPSGFFGDFPEAEPQL